MFHQLWKAGDTAHLDLDTHAGQAWIGLRTPLGLFGQPRQYPSQTRQYPPQTPTNRQYPPPSPTHRSPSYYHRQERRKQTKLADSKLINNEEIPADEAESIITSDAIHTDIVVYPQQEVEPEPEKSKINPPLEADELPFTTSETMDELSDNNPDEKAGELHSDKHSDNVNHTLTTEEVESTIEAKFLEFTDVNANNDRFQCEKCEFNCKWYKSMKMHMLKTHSSIESSEDSNDVTTAIKDDTSPTTYSPINPTSNPTTPTTNLTINPNPNLNLNINPKPNPNPNNHEQTAPICHHFQRGACNYGEHCWKRHEPPDPSHLTCPKCDLTCKNRGQLNYHILFEHDPN